MTFADWCRTNNKLKLLELYDNDASDKSAFEISYSTSKISCWCKCPDCGRTWKTTPNKLNRLAEKKYNFYTQKELPTYCVACGGEEVSRFYNLKEIVPEICDYYDYELNDKKPEDYSPKCRERIFIKCNNSSCDYKKNVVIKNFVRCIRTYKCSVCQGGNRKEATSHYNLETEAPDVAKEFDVKLNNGEKATQILPSLNKSRWFTCSVCNHSYPARVSNRAYLGRGCPECNKKRQTSFVEQMFYFYIKKCILNAENRAIDVHTDLEIDIFLQDQLRAVECKSKYFHKKVSPKKQKSYTKKLKELTKYYRVISLQEYESNYLDDMIEHHILPVFTHSKNTYRVYNNIIRDLLIKLIPDAPNYPSVDIERDILQILRLFIKTKIKNSFEETHPNYKKTWDNSKNEDLKPNMFTAGNSSYKFHWTCLNCKNCFRSSISNRKKIPYDRCPECNSEKSKNNKTDEYALAIRPFWNEKMNTIKFEDLRFYSEDTIILRLFDGRCVPVKCYNIFSFIEKNQNIPLQVYLEKCFEERHQYKSLDDF